MADFSTALYPEFVGCRLPNQALNKHINAPCSCLCMCNPAIPKPTYSNCGGAKKCLVECWVFTLVKESLGVKHACNRKPRVSLSLEIINWQALLAGLSCYINSIVFWSITIRWVMCKSPAMEQCIDKVMSRCLDNHLSDCCSSHVSWVNDWAKRAARTGKVTGCFRALHISSITCTISQL